MLKVIFALGLLLSVSSIAATAEIPSLDRGLYRSPFECPISLKQSPDRKSVHGTQALQRILLQNGEPFDCSAEVEDFELDENQGVYWNEGATQSLVIETSQVIYLDHAQFVFSPEATK